MKTITFKIHSFVDLITNSSSEVFVAASKSTVDTVKEIVNTLLKQSNSTATCDDLFDIDFVIPKGSYFINPNYDEDDEDSEEEICLKEDVYSDSPDFAKYREWKSDCENPYIETSLRVKAKNDNPETIKVANLFEKIIGTYDINSVSNY
jgi:hypothetical protein